MANQTNTTGPAAVTDELLVVKLCAPGDLDQPNADGEKAYSVVKQHIEFHNDKVPRHGQYFDKIHLKRFWRPR